MSFEPVPHPNDTARPFVHTRFKVKKAYTHLGLHYYVGRQGGQWRCDIVAVDPITSQPLHLVGQGFGVSKKTAINSAYADKNERQKERARAWEKIEEEERNRP